MHCGAFCSVGVNHQTNESVSVLEKLYSGESDVDGSLMRSILGHKIYSKIIFIQLTLNILLTVTFDNFP